MILRYIVDTRHSKTFTVTKTGVDECDILGIICGNDNKNEKLGYKKYSGSRVYSDANTPLFYFMVSGFVDNVGACQLNVFAENKRAAEIIAMNDYNFYKIINTIDKQL